MCMHIYVYVHWRKTTGYIIAVIAYTCRWLHQREEKLAAILLRKMAALKRYEDGCYKEMNGI